uniref:Ubiquitin-like protein 3 n=1 Tax=Bos indicus x Bos taurus TaxID=30522 RepID=A0A4W2FG66_BOBOX
MSRRICSFLSGILNPASSGVAQKSSFCLPSPAGLPQAPGSCSAWPGCPVLINLRLILVSGKTKEFLFSPNDSASDIAKHVYDNWPMDWEEEQVSSPNILRLIYQGRFLHGNVTLGALKLPFGKTTVMHLVARETLPEPNSQGQRNREKTGESNCCVIL